MKNLREFNNVMLAGGLATINLATNEKPSILVPIKDMYWAGSMPDVNKEGHMHVQTSRFVSEYGVDLYGSETFMTGIVHDEVWRLSVARSFDNIQSAVEYSGDHGTGRLYDFKTGSWYKADDKTVTKMRVNRLLDLVVNRLVPIFVASVVIGISLWLIFG